MMPYVQHLHRVVSAFSLDVEIEQLLKKDFIFIRSYIIEIVKRDPILKCLVINGQSVLLENPLNVSLVLDLRQIFEIKPHFDCKMHSYINLTVTGQTQNYYNLKESSATLMRFHDESMNIDGKCITNYIRYQIVQGLKYSGCFVLGHKGDVYELELNKAHQTEGCITIDINFGSGTISVDFRVLLKFDAVLQPYPIHRKKLEYLADVNLHEPRIVNKFIFWICSPLIEKEISTYRQFVAAYRLLLRMFMKRNMFCMKSLLVSVLCDVYLLSNKSTLNKVSVGYILVAVLRRMKDYITTNLFPFYWDMRINMLEYYGRNITNIRPINQQLKCILDDIFRLENKKNLTYDELHDFFGIEVNVEAFKIDNFGIYQSF